MSSLTDDELNWQPPADLKFLPAVQAPSTSGNSNAVVQKLQSQANDTPIFSKRSMQLRLPANFQGEITHLNVCKHWLVCVLVMPKQTTLLRYFLKRATLQPAVVLLDKYLTGYKISKLFLDQTGYHLLISLVPISPGLSADFLYVHENGDKVRRIEKFKDFEITAVAFNNYNGTESSTGAILLGTNRGLIFETELTVDGDRSTYRKQIYDVSKERIKCAITGLKVLRLPQSQKYVVLVATPDAVLTFQETLKPDERTLQPIFNVQPSVLIEDKQKFTNFSVLKCFAHANEKSAKYWCWLCGVNLHVGLLAPHNILPRHEFIVLTAMAKSFVLTEHHVLLLYADHITGICLLNQQVVYQQYFLQSEGKLQHMVRDAFTGTIYVYTDKALFYIHITDEARDIWQIYLEKEEYDLAELYAADNAQNLQIVKCQQAQAAYDNKQYVEAARLYAQTQQPFEEVSLKFIDLPDKQPLVTYLKLCLQAITDPFADEHIKVLITWLIDLYLTQINHPDKSREEREQWQAQYDEFMSQPAVRQCARENAAGFQKLIAKHADAHNMSSFAVIIGDYEEVMNQLIIAKNYNKALETLQRQQNVQLVYKYAPLLMQELPQPTVEMLRGKGKQLEFKQLVHTLIVTETPAHVKEIIKYLEYAVYNLHEENEAAHNYLLQMYLQHRPQQVMSYLEVQGTDAAAVKYDKNYALLICKKHQHNAALVFIYCLLGMWENAVDLALTFDVNLAKEKARQPEDEHIQRELWLRIAKHEIEGQTQDVEKGLALLKECELLSIEDLLPFFSDFEKIDQLKEPICQALQKYIDELNEIEHEQQEMNKLSEDLRADLQNLRECHIELHANEVCSICAANLLVKPFFLFICGHKYHTDCLEKQVVPLLSADISRKLTMLKQQLDAVLTQIAVKDAEPTAAEEQQRDKLKSAIEEILAADCYYCGMLIDYIDKPFVDDWERAHVDWL